MHLIFSIPKFEAQRLMTSQIRSQTEYLMPTDYFVVHLLQINKNIALLAGFQSDLMKIQKWVSGLLFIGRPCMSRTAF